MRIRSGLAVAAFTLLFLAACAAPLPPRPELVHGQGLLWQVEKNGGEPSYVFGTMHVSDPEILDLPAAVEDAFANSGQAAFELVTPKDKAVRQARRFIAAAMLPDGQSLEELLGAVDYSQIIRIARRQRPQAVMIGHTHISNFKPWFVTLVIGRNDSSASHLDHRGPSLDDWLEARAKAEGKKVVGIESFEEQLDVFDGMPMEEQVALLRSGLKNYNKWRSYRTSADLYLDGDTATAFGLWQESLEHLDTATAWRITDRFLFNRNQIMVDRITPLMEDESTFVAVGALHLPGEEGILSLLEREGYEVARLH